MPRNIGTFESDEEFYFNDNIVHQLALIKYLQKADSYGLRCRCGTLQFISTETCPNCQTAYKTSNEERRDAHVNLYNDEYNNQALAIGHFRKMGH